MESYHRFDFTRKSYPDKASLALLGVIIGDLYFCFFLEKSCVSIGLFDLHCKRKSVVFKQMNTNKRSNHKNKAYGASLLIPFDFCSVVLEISVLSVRFFSDYFLC